MKKKKSESQKEASVSTQLAKEKTAFELESQKFKTYLCDYQYEGSTWSVEISATSFEDAENRLKALNHGEIVGELKLSVPIPVKQTWLERLMQWL